MKFLVRTLFKIVEAGLNWFEKLPLEPVIDVICYPMEMLMKAMDALDNWSKKK